MAMTRVKCPSALRALALVALMAPAPATCQQTIVEIVQNSPDHTRLLEYLLAPQYAALVFVLATALGAGCAAGFGRPGSPRGLCGTCRYQSVLAALQAASLANPLTVFAPTDAAFAALEAREGVNYLTTTDPNVQQAFISALLVCAPAARRNSGFPGAHTACCAASTPRSGLPFSARALCLWCLCML